MTTGQKIYECRRKAGMTQEALADRLGVSRQAVSKWESDNAFPETEKILELCRLFSLSADELLLGKDAPVQEVKREEKPGGWRYEYVSEAKVRGLPLVHINLGAGFCRAKGIIAVGNIATGFIAVGAVSVGMVSIGALAVGLCALGAFVLGLLALGGVSLGLFVCGGIAVGVFSLGGVCVGYFAAGGVAAGRYAVGDRAQGYLAAGLSYAGGANAFLVSDTLLELSDWLDKNVSQTLASAIEWFASVLRNGGT